MALIEYVSKMDVHLQANSPDGVSTEPLTYIGDIYQVKISTKTNDNPVATFGGAKGKGGVAGYSSGYVETQITFDKATPRAGDNFNLLEVMLNHSNIVLFGTVGRKRRKYEGRILSRDEDYGLNKASADSVVIHAGEPEVVNQ